MENSVFLVNKFKENDRLEQLKALISVDNIPDDATHISRDGGVIARKQKRKSKDGKSQFMMILKRGKWVSGLLHEGELDRTYALISEVRELVK